MQDTRTGRRTDGRVAFGLVLVLVGAAVLVLRQMGTDVIAAIEPAGWPFFVIIPGVVLLGASLIPTPPRGVGLAIAGAIVTTIGTMLFVMQLNEWWQSWAYAWALIPAGAGVGSLLYGLYGRQRDLVGNGLRLIAIAGVLFLVGAWFFETTFATGRAPIDLSTWWPVIVIALGVVAVIGGIVAPSRRDQPGTPTSAEGGRT